MPDKTGEISRPVLFARAINRDRCADAAHEMSAVMIERAIETSRHGPGDQDVALQCLLQLATRRTSETPAT
jgi:hypothetical protein